MEDYDLTFYEACEFLSRSRKSITRYVLHGMLHPKRIKSQRGTLEYRFSKKELTEFKDKMRHDTPEDEVDHEYKTEIMEVPKQQNDETFVDFLKEQIKVKDSQIAELLERQRETNILMQGLHDTILRLERGDKTE